jgi:hypothetical protein
MSPRLTSLALVAVLLGTGAFAILRADNAPHASPTASPVPPETQVAGEATDPPALPPGHPSIGTASSPHGAVVPQTSDPPTITWKAPSAWTEIANPTAMRLATYRVPHAPGDADNAELSVTRAGGTTDANIERWLGQFDNRGKDTRTAKDIHGLKVTVVEVSGTYLGGGMMGGASTPHAGWTLLGAIVEGPGAPYFFKVTGPTATVRSSRAAFDSLLGSITSS